MLKNSFSNKTLSYCALLVSLSVILARIASIAPNTFSRFSIESVPVIISGILFGPLHGVLVGLAADFIGCQFSPFGYNPIFCIPPLLYGLCGGLFRPILLKKVTLIRLIFMISIPAVFGSIFIQSIILDFVYHKGFLYFLSTRTLQFSVVIILDALIIKLLFNSNMFYTLGLWRTKHEHK